MVRSGSASRRAPFIVGLLALVGTISLVTKVVLKTSYTALDAALDLGYAGLPAALLYIVLNQAIDSYQSQLVERQEVVDRLLGVEQESATVLVERLSKDGSVENFDLSGTAKQLDLRLKAKTLTKGKLNRCDLDLTALIDCQLRDISVQHSSFRLCVLEKCTFDQVNFAGTDLTGTLFVGCEFGRGTTFPNATLDDVRFKDCILSNETAASVSGTPAVLTDCINVQYN